MKKIKNILLFLPTFIFLNLGFSLLNPIHAQSLSLSISPPIKEIMIIPGKEVTESFTIANDGNDGMASIYIIPFRAQGENGGVSLDEKNIVNGDSPYANWFTIISPVSSFGEKFYMAGGSKQTVTIKFSPSIDAVEKDYYFTILFELNNEVPGSITPLGSVNQARIGSNILLSLSADGVPQKTLDIVEFSAPKVIDSLAKLSFNVRIGNYSSYYFKPDGKIDIKSTFGQSESLILAPLNVISDSIRNISCQKGEELVKCQSGKKVLIGVYKSTLLINTDGIGIDQKKTVTTIAFPFSITLGLLVILMAYKIIKRSLKDTRNQTQ